MNVMNEPQANVIINHMAKIYEHLMSHSRRIENRLEAIEKRLEAIDRLNTFCKDKPNG